MNQYEWFFDNNVKVLWATEVERKTELEALKKKNEKKSGSRKKGCNVK